MTRIHALINIKTALDFLQRRQIRLVNINPADIADGRCNIILGLVWTIILYFQIEDNASNLSEYDAMSRTASLDSLNNHSPNDQLLAFTAAEVISKFRSGAQKALMVWIQKRLAAYSGYCKVGQSYVRIHTTELPVGHFLMTHDPLDPREQ